MHHIFYYFIGARGRSMNVPVGGGTPPPGAGTDHNLIWKSDTSLNWKDSTVIAWRGV